VLLVLPWSFLLWALFDSARAGVVEMVWSALIFGLLIFGPVLIAAGVRAGLRRRKGTNVAERTPESSPTNAKDSIGEEPAGALTGPRDPLLPVAASLLANRRCGSCAFELDPGTKDSHGLVTCPECGAAWHTDRFMPPELAPKLAGMSMPAQLTGRVACSPADDRGVACTALDENDSRLRPVIGGAMIKSIAVDLAGLRRKRAGALFVIALGVGVIVPLVALAGLEDQDLAIGMSLVVAAFLVLVGLIQLGRTTFAETRATWLAHGRCPCCAASLLELEARFDACVTCPGCARAWRINEVRAKKPPDICPRCGYAMAGLTRCPECAYPSRRPFDDRPPGSVPLCARCSTELPGENRMCPKCGVMAGVKWG
jgi:ssDNA-binding Zn-finger/Zn-ribbon topoisomerase 1